jgi:two-component system chemotaxis response regulator CheB
MDRSELSGRVDAVVIGTSAGGVEALSAVLPGVLAGCRAPVLVVVHLPRDRPSLLPSVFAPKCAVAVREAQDKEPVEPGTIYFAPPDYHLLVDEGPQLSLSVDDPVFFSRPSIDVLFESAADAYGPRLVGVLLAGANADGVAGLTRIVAAGGTALVQAPATARAAEMPEAAVRAGHRRTMSPGELGRWIACAHEVAP